MQVPLRASRLALVPIAPALLVQGRRLRRDTPRLPDAALPWRGEVTGYDAARPLRLVLLGDSTVAGVGAATQEEALPGGLARGLASTLGRDVTWRATGRNGATARDLILDHLDDATSAPADLVFLSVGANDALTVRSRGAFTRDLRHIIRELREASPEAVILMSSLPAFGRFAMLPQPLKSSLYRHSLSLEDAARRVIDGTDRAHMSPPPPPYTPGFFATDGFHPSASGYADWAEFAVEDAVASGVLAYVP